MRRTFAFLAALALAVVGTMSGCEDGSSTSSNSGANPIVGVWSDSSDYSKEVLTIGADNSYAQVTTTSIGGASSYQRTSGTWSIEGDLLKVSLNKLESSADGVTWVTVSTASSTRNASYLVAGQILSLTIGGLEKRYVQGTSGIVPSEVVAAPSFSPGEGTYASAQTVEIIPANAGVEIYFTLDGTTPTTYSGTLYTEPIQVGATKTIKAIAVKGSKTSPVATATITIKADNGGTGIEKALVGTWSVSVEGFTQTETFNSNGTFVEFSDIPDAVQYGGFRYSRVSGNWSVSGDSLTKDVTKQELSENNSTWKSATVNHVKITEEYSISGSILTITDEQGYPMEYTKTK